MVAPGRNILGKSKQIAAYNRPTITDPYTADGHRPQ